MVRLYGSICKVEEQEDGTLLVEGVASSERRDGAGEIVTADAMRDAIPGYLRPDGTGPLREMHQLKAAGKTTQIYVDDDGMTRVSTLVVDPDAVTKVKTGVYQGFSIGGKALRRDGEDPSIIRRLKLSEISLVDRGENPDAVYTLVKIDGGTMGEPRPWVKLNELVTAFKRGELSIDAAEGQAAEILKVAARKDVNPKAGKEKYGNVEFADEKNKKYPIDTAEHIRAAWNYIHKPKNAEKYSAKDLAAIKSKIVAAWKKKIDEDGPPSADQKKAATAGDIRKGMYQVAQAAQVFDGLESLQQSTEYERDREGDDSKVPEMLHEAMGTFAEAIRALVEEELTEALEEKDDGGAVALAATPDGLAKAAQAITTKLARRMTMGADETIKKAAAVLSEEHKAALADVHDHVKECHKRLGKVHKALKAMRGDAEADDGEGDDDGKQAAAAPGDLQKAVDGAVSKALEPLRAELAKRDETIAKADEALRALLTEREALSQELAKRPKGALRAIPVEKAADNGTAKPGETSDDELQKAARNGSLSQEEREAARLALIKRSFGRPMAVR